MMFSADTRLRDQINLIEESSEMDILAGSVKDTGGVYFVTAFAGLLAPYWDRSAVSVATRGAERRGSCGVVQGEKGRGAVTHKSGMRGSVCRFRSSRTSKRLTLPF